MKALLKNNNKGSTIVLVLIAMLLGSVLAATLMFTSYTGYMMKLSDRAAKETFYTAESLMDEIRTGLEEAVSDSIITAYTKVLGEYSTVSEETAEAHFGEYYITALKGWKYSDTDDALFTVGSDNTITYNTDMLLTFLSTADGVTLFGSGKVVSRTGDGGRVVGLTLKDVSVRYVSNGYMSVVTTDINLGVPTFSYTLSELVITSVPDYALIANETLNCTGIVTVNIDGNAYAGAINISGFGSRLSVSSGTIICKSELDVGNSGSFILRDNSILWANSIGLGGSALLELAGDAYVADDLSLNGNYARAYLAGRYFGFGNGDTSSSSSSIVVNAGNTVLDLSGLRTLMLAGTSFISDPSGGAAGTNDVLTGESVSVKSYQRAYLVPEECVLSTSTVQSSNPMVFNTTQLSSVGMPAPDYIREFVNLDAQLWDGKTLRDYVGNAPNLQIVFFPISGSGQTLVYIYMGFDTAREASDYFADYFTNNKDDIEKYLSLYSTQIISAPASAGKTTDGNLVYYNSSTASLVESGDTGVVSESTSQALKTKFSNLCQTLKDSVSGGSGYIDVYNYIVNTQMIAEHVSGELEFRDVSGVPLGIVVDGDYTVDVSTPGTLRVIIATGNVSVSSGFTGVIIAGGTINASANLTSDRAGVNAAFAAEAQVGEDGTPETVTLLSFMLSSDDPGDESQGINVSWNMDSLVSYQNWSKN